MITTIKSVLFPSVDNITAQLNSTVVRLNKLAARKLEAAGSLRAEAERTHTVADAADAEAQRALRTSARISKLLA
jgi:cell division septum initiation protein DivIVA